MQHDCILLQAFWGFLYAVLSRDEGLQTCNCAECVPNFERCLCFAFCDAVVPSECLCEVHSGVLDLQAEGCGHLLTDWTAQHLGMSLSMLSLQISLANWNQDEEFGGFGPPHCMVKGGYSTLTDALAKQVDVRLGQPVKRIAYNGQGVTVTTASGEGCGPLTTVTGSLQ